MTDPQSLILGTAAISSADDLVAFWTALMGGGGFGRRSLWLVLLDQSGRAAPVVVPIDDIPAYPGPREVEAFGRVLAGLADIGTPVLLLTRPGSSQVQDGDRRWAEALAPLAPAWPVHLATVPADDSPALCAVRALPVP
jgi:hypothetical protein